MGALILRIWPSLLKRTLNIEVHNIRTRKDLWILLESSIHPTFYGLPPSVPYEINVLFYPRQLRSIMRTSVLSSYGKVSSKWSMEIPEPHNVCEIRKVVPQGDRRILLSPFWS